MDIGDARGWTIRNWALFRPSTWAIATRSAAVSALIVIASLAVATALLLAVLYGTLMSSEDDASAERVADIVGALRSEGATEIPDELLATDQSLAAVQVIASDGQVVLRSADAPTTPLLSPADVGLGLTKGMSGTDPSGNNVRVSGQRADTANGQYIVVVAADTASVNSTVKSAAVLLVAVAPLVLAETACVNFLLVKRSLQSVDGIRTQVAEISASDLSGRVPVPATRDEIAALATTMNDMLARIEAGHDTQRRFVGDASHELRSPLATIISTLEVVDAHPHLLEHELVSRTLLPEAQRMRALIDDLLLLARADESALIHCDNAVELTDVIADETARLRSRTSLTVYEDAGDVCVRGDENGLSRLLRNLLDNAARHARSRIDVTAHADGHNAVITVGDDGPGIAEADRLRVFDRFVRLDTDRSRQRGGTGLGLAIVAEIVAQHHGTVVVDSRPDGGARITVTLPLAS